MQKFVFGLGSLQARRRPPCPSLRAPGGGHAGGCGVLQTLIQTLSLHALPCMACTRAQVVVTLAVVACPNPNPTHSPLTARGARPGGGHAGVCGVHGDGGAGRVGAGGDRAWWRPGALVHRSRHAGPAPPCVTAGLAAARHVIDGLGTWSQSGLWPQSGERLGLSPTPACRCKRRHAAQAPLAVMWCGAHARQEALVSSRLKVCVLATTVCHVRRTQGCPALPPRSQLLNAAEARARPGAGAAGPLGDRVPTRPRDVRSAALPGDDRPCAPGRPRVPLLRLSTGLGRQACSSVT
jgi:hypothetical protein